MSATFQVALRAERPLDLILYKFLEEHHSQNRAERRLQAIKLKTPTPGSRSIQDEEVMVLRQLNGRYKGLLECPCSLYHGGTGDEIPTEHSESNSRLHGVGSETPV